MSHTEGALKLLSDYLKQAAAQKPEHTALIAGDERISYAELARRVEKLAAYLIKTGVQKGDRLAYVFAPCPEFMYLYLAAARVGAVITGMGTRQTEPEMTYVLNNSQASHIFSLYSMYDIDYQDRFASILPQCTTVKSLIIAQGQARLPQAVSLEEILQGDYTAYLDELQRREAELDADDGLLIVYTSGSTGTPKGALMSHRNIIHMSLVELAMCDGNGDDIWLNHLPVNHVSGATEVGATALVANATQVMEPFNPARTLEIIQTEKVTILGQVPTMFAIEFALPNYADYDFTSLRAVVISGAPAPVETLKKMKETMCDNCYNCLGLTEVSGLITFTERGASLETLNLTVGKCAPDFAMKLTDPDRREVAPGEVGEIAYRGTSVIKEYFMLPEATKAAFDDEGWFYSGDLGLIDADGNLRMVGRSKEIYITNGYNVYPAEVEDAIMKFPGVMLCACVGVPHPVAGEIGRAYVVPLPGHTIDTEQLKEFLKDHLSSYKIPREYVLREMLPMTMLGKIEKKLLRQEVAAEAAASRE
ncbi:MAG TPA: class I adenylate-forming enzyme family protein [Syntrophomonas sp.]|nr:class I adenylate-forming enzyme family protein [Syntrophomonas sp.]